MGKYKYVGVFSLMLVLGGACSLAAQCWDCGTTYWPGNDCWMETCYWTSSAGSSNCTQYGECGDMDTCDTNGHGCVGDVTELLLDGRADLGIGVTAAARLTGDEANRSNFGVVATIRETGLYFSLACNGILIGAIYSEPPVARPWNLLVL